MNLHIPYEYSFGIRQGLYKAHRNTPRVTIKEGHEASAPSSTWPWPSA